MDAISTAPLFGPLTGELTGLLRTLSVEDWRRPTAAGDWRVRDVVAHLIDGNLRRLSAERDGHAAPAPAEPIGGHRELVAYLDALNAEWVAAAQRLSPRVLLELLEQSDREVSVLVSGADPQAPATFPVAWAGRADSPMWLDHGREYTERWHHQDQIREAVGAAPLAAARWLRPVLDISLLALPHAYAGTPAAEGATVAIVAEGPAGGEWSLVRRADAWTLRPGARQEAATRLRTTDLLLARLLLHRLGRDAVAAAVEIEGDATLATPLLEARAVMV